MNNPAARILLTLIVVGLVWWLIGYLPLPDPFPTLIRVVVIVAVIWELLALVTGWPSLLNRTNRPPT